MKIDKSYCFHACESAQIRMQGAERERFFWSLYDIHVLFIVHCNIQKHHMVTIVLCLKELVPKVVVVHGIRDGSEILNAIRGSPKGLKNQSPKNCPRPFSHNLLPVRGAGNLSSENVPLFSAGVAIGCLQLDGVSRGCSKLHVHWEGYQVYHGEI